MPADSSPQGINKIDLPSAEPQRVIDEIEDVIGIEAQDAPQRE